MFRFVKRLMDISISLFLIIAFSPIITLIAVVIKMESFKDPIIYRGKRALNRRDTFYLYKFRTMVPHEEQIGNHSTALNDLRLTSIGRFLRKYKLDELPQLLNVIKGQMSLVGPRPQVTFYTDKYEGKLLRILDASPGITDLASLYFIDMDKTLGEGDVNNIYESTIEPIKNELRLIYVDNMSLNLDLYILILTGLKVLHIVDEGRIISFLKDRGLIKGNEIFKKKNF